MKLHIQCIIRARKVVLKYLQFLVFEIKILCLLTDAVCLPIGFTTNGEVISLLFNVYTAPNSEKIRGYKSSVLFVDKYLRLKTSISLKNNLPACRSAQAQNKKRNRSLTPGCNVSSFSSAHVRDPPCWQPDNSSQGTRNITNDVFVVTW